MKILIFLISAIIFFSCQSVQKNDLNTNTEDSLTMTVDTSISINPEESDINDTWSIKSFVDDFGEKSKDSYVETVVYGTFSNSATTDAYLKVTLLLTTKNAGLFLQEYNDSRPAQKFIGTGKILFRNSEEKDLTIYSLREWSQTGGLNIEDNNFKKLRDYLLSSKGKIKVVVYDEYSSVYNFSIDVDSLDKHYTELKTAKSKN